MSKERPNVLFLFDDQHNAGCLGFLGHPLIKTPNLDALAAKGAVFNNMYSCSGICAPSRTSFFTGTYLRTHGMFYNFGDLAKPFPSILSELGNEGYTKIMAGKNHLPHAISKDFDTMWNQDILFHELCQASKVTTHAEPWNQHFQSNTWGFTKEEHRGVWTGQKTIDFLDSAKSKEKPFFIWTSFDPPHCPHNPTKEMEDLYNPDDIPVDWEEYYQFEQSKMQNRPMVEDFWKLGSVKQNVDLFKKAVCRYFALISMVDEEVGRILKSLEQNGLSDDTIVIFSSDHGDFAGNYGQLGKNLPAYEQIIKIPFIYHDPYNPCHGRFVEGMFQNVDLFPSILDRLALPIPPTVQGVSFLPSLQGRPSAARNSIFSETSMEKTIRTQHWKLTYFVRHPHKGQLFRMTPRVNEIENLWDDARFSQVKTELLEKLMEWMVACEQPISMDEDWEEYIKTPWYDWLKQQPRKQAIAEPPYTNLPSNS
jgi:arylsulfatase